jgi:hypothetical protein
MEAGRTHMDMACVSGHSRQGVESSPAGEGLPLPLGIINELGPGLGRGVRKPNVTPELLPVPLLGEGDGLGDGELPLVMLVPVVPFMGGGGELLLYDGDGDVVGLGPRGPARLALPVPVVDVLMAGGAGVAANLGVGGVGQQAA